jgi:hypothetical protein
MKIFEIGIFEKKVWNYLERKDPCLDKNLEKLN